ncbi:hypothetical protein [Ralstonia syzygii]
MNLRYRVELDQSEREVLAAMLSGGTQTQASPDPACSTRWPG